MPLTRCLCAFACFLFLICTQFDCDHSIEPFQWSDGISHWLQEIAEHLNRKYENRKKNGLPFANTEIVLHRAQETSFNTLHTIYPSNWMAMNLNRCAMCTIWKLFNSNENISRMADIWTDTMITFYEDANGKCDTNFIRIYFCHIGTNGIGKTKFKSSN